MCIRDSVSTFIFIERLPSNQYLYFFIWAVCFFIPGLVVSLLVFTLSKPTTNTKINISVVLLIALVFVLSGFFFPQHQTIEGSFLMVFLGFLSIKWVERNIGKFNSEAI